MTGSEVSIEIGELYNVVISCAAFRKHSGFPDDLPVCARDRLSACRDKIYSGQVILAVESGNPPSEIAGYLGREGFWFLVKEELRWIRAGAFHCIKVCQ